MSSQQPELLWLKIGEVYHHEKICRQKGFNAQERLAYHQTHFTYLDSSLFQKYFHIIFIDIKGVILSLTR